MTTTVQEKRYESAPQFDDAVEALSDEYVCRILSALVDGAMPAADIATECDICRQTVYRRLNQLEAIGFVTTQVKCEPGGTQRRYFRLNVDEVHFAIRENGIDEQVSVAGSDAD
jgi:DNA-binding HxlR family transcriptional regulator